jgi:hypothetical protein
MIYHYKNFNCHQIYNYKESQTDPNADCPQLSFSIDKKTLETILNMNKERVEAEEKKHNYKNF